MDLNPPPFDHGSGGLTTELSLLPVYFLLTSVSIVFPANMLLDLRAVKKLTWLHSFITAKKYSLTDMKTGHL